MTCQMATGRKEYERIVYRIVYQSDRQPKPAMDLLICSSIHRYSDERICRRRFQFDDGHVQSSIRQLRRCQLAVIVGSMPEHNKSIYNDK